jgi:predicted O-methyltransferase YrrM
MVGTFEAADWHDYAMKYRQPHEVIEPSEKEIETVRGALEVLADAGILSKAEYDQAKMLAFRDAVRETFEIPWTAITPRMQRLLYAINAIAQPKTMVAVGIFCGFTFISNAGAAIGPGSVYRARRLVGIEIDEEEARRARRNVSRIDADGTAEILATDGLPWLREFTDVIDLLYLDANGADKGKAIYLDMLKAAEHSLRPGSVVVAHNSVNHSRPLAEYLEYVRSGGGYRESINVFIDQEGIEVSLR